MYIYCMQDQTTIRISRELLEFLNKLKSDKKTYEDVIWEIIEPYLEDSDEIKGLTSKAKKEYSKGEIIDFKILKERHGF